MQLRKDTHDFSLILDVDAPERSYSVEERPVFTVKDAVTGTVTLRVKNDINVKDIQVKISGRSKTRVSKMVKKGDKTKEETETTDHELVYDVETLFPPLNVKQVSKNSKFTLVPGEYVHHFALRFPFNSMCGDPRSIRDSNLNSSRYEESSNKHSKHHKISDGQSHVMSMLPPSFTETTAKTLENKSVNKASITYQIKASLHRHEMFASSTRLIGDIDFIQPGPALSQIPSIPLMTYHSNRVYLRNSEYRLRLITQQIIVPGYQEWHLTLQSTSCQPLSINGLSMELQGEVSICSEKFTSKVLRYIPLKNIERIPISSTAFEANPNNDPEFRYQTDLSIWLDPINFNAVSDFTTCNISLKHDLTLSCTIEGVSCKLVVNDVTVSGPPLDDDDYVNIYGYRPSTTIEPSSNIPEEKPPSMPQRPKATASNKSSSPFEEAAPPAQPPRPEQLPSYEQALNSSP